MRTRRQIVMGAAAAAGSILVPPLAAAPIEWRKLSPSDAGLASDIEARLDKLVTSGRAWNQHGIVVLRKGALVLERYGAGEDEINGDSIGRVAFGPDTLHDLRSVTKSVLGLLYGIALAQGRVPAPERLLLEALPEYAGFATDPRAKRLTIANALTLSLGLDWNEEVPYEDPANGEARMEAAPDRYRFIFSRPFVADPGTRWIYGAASPTLIGKPISERHGPGLAGFCPRRAVRSDRHRRDRVE